jgi:uncharacterized repeat protein (TIGR03803 family)
MRNAFATILFAVALGLIPAPANAQPLTILHNFVAGPNDGKNPQAALTASGNTLYGMCSSGANEPGIVFQIGTDGGGFSLLHTFTGGLTDGANPMGSLTLTGTSFYGTTYAGGNAGTVFTLNTDGSGFSLLHSFAGGANDGIEPHGTLIQSGPTLYGMTIQGGAANMGTIFQVNTNGTGFGLLHSFTGGANDGGLPSYNMLTQSGNALYGMTGGGGPTDNGVIFHINSDGSGFTVMHTFVPSTGDGWDSIGSLALSKSTLYGMTSFGSGGAGTIFKINTDGTGYQILHTFTGQVGGDGANPLADLLISGSEMFGMTPAGGPDNLGTIFEMNLDGTGYQVLHSFAGGPNDGSMPNGDLMLVGSTLYGMTVVGGTDNLGVIFSFPIAVPEPSPEELLIAACAVAYLSRFLRLPQPFRQLGLGCSREAMEIALSFEERFLD